MARILYVEDEWLQASATQSGLEDAAARLRKDGDHAIHMELARDPKEAMQKIMAGEPFDLVLTDYNMGPENGVDLARQLRDHGFTRPIVLYTSQSEASVRAKHQDFDHLGLQYVQKLTSIVNVHEKIQAALKSQGQGAGRG